MSWHKKNSWTMKRKVMPSKEHVRELRCERSKQGHIATNLINMTKKLVNRCFSKNLSLYFILKFYRRNGWTFIQRLFCWIEFFKFSVEFRNRIWWLQFAHLVGKNSEKNHIFCQPYLWWGNSCSLGAAFSTMRLTLCSMKICYIRLPEIAHCCHARHSHQSDFVDNLFLLSPFSNRIKTTAILLLISVTDVFLCV